MYGAKSKGNNVPSDAQARERLALYVYEYLLHVGAQKAASTFLTEIRWEKQITLGDPPGFLHSWWCVFWDLYCASPERRDASEHSPEAKAFHDYSAATAPSPINPMTGEGMNTPGMPPNFFPAGTAPSPSPHHNPNNPMIRQTYMPSRYPSGASGPRGMQGPVSGPQGLMQGMERNQIMGMHRMPGGHPHSRGIPGNMNPGWSPSEQFSSPSMGGPYRLPNNSSGMPPMSMAGRPWNGGPGVPSGYNMPSSPNYGQPPSGGPPTTPMLQSPQDSMNPDFQMDPKMGGTGAMHSPFPISSGGPDGPPSGNPMSGPGPGGVSVSMPSIPPVMNGLNGSSTADDGLPKSSPNSMPPMTSLGANTMGGPQHGNGPNSHTPQEGEGDSFNMGPPFQDDQNESAAILKIKESMQQEAKQFESKDDGNERDFPFMQ